eukprot:753954-Hanusia_phi.AAC.3
MRGRRVEKGKKGGGGGGGELTQHLNNLHYGGQDSQGRGAAGLALHLAPAQALSVASCDQDAPVRVEETSGRRRRSSICWKLAEEPLRHAERRRRRGGGR